jgi:hypothetical protein
VVIDETAPLKGHHAAYSDAFNPSAACIGYFLDPATRVAGGEFRCGHDEFAALRNAVRTIKPEALAGDGVRWFGYFEKSGQEIVLTVPRDVTLARPLVEYAWGKGVLVKFRPGAITMAAERHGAVLRLPLGNGTVAEADPTAMGGMRVTFLRLGQTPLVANLMPVGN